MDHQSTVSIYRILDPRTLAVVYIGRTTCSLPERLAGHLAQRGSCESIGVPFYEWLQIIVDELGLMPLIEVIKACPALPVDVAEHRERFWYCHYRLHGACLLNRNLPGFPTASWGCEFERPTRLTWWRRRFGSIRNYCEWNKRQALDH